MVADDNLFLSEVSSIVLDNARAWHILGWRPEVNVSEGIRRAVALLHEQEEPPVPLEMREASLRVAS